MQGRKEKRDRNIDIGNSSLAWVSLLHFPRVSIVSAPQSISLSESIGSVLQSTGLFIFSLSISYSEEMVHICPFSLKFF